MPKTPTFARRTPLFPSTLPPLDLPRVGVFHAAVDVQDVARAIVIFELVRLYAVCGGALLAPARAPDPGPLQHSIGVDGVDPDACVLARGHGVLGGHEDEAAAHALLFHDAKDLAHDQEVAFGEDSVVLVPHLDARLLDGGVGGEAGVRHDDVGPAKLEDRTPVGTRYLAFVRNVGASGDPGLGQVLGDLPRPFLVEV